MRDSGSGSSGAWNSDSANSGFQNWGALETGWANLGNTISRVFNTSTVGLVVSAFDSGVENIGALLAGFFRTGTGP